jgi:Zn-dependent alcohol dehydrogenase
LVVVSALPRDAVFNLSPREFGSSQQRIVGCVYGSIDPPRDLALFASWYLEGRLALDDLVSGHIPFLELPAAFRNPPKGIRNVVAFN